MQAIFSSNRRKERWQCYNRWKNASFQSVENDLRTYDNIWKIETGQLGDYTTGCLLNYPYF